MSLFEINNASFSYPKRMQTFQKVSFKIEQGQIFTILGPNGAGKSTLLSCIAGLNSLTTGKITLNGRDISHMSRKEIAHTEGFVPQNIDAVFSYSVIEYVVMGRAAYISSLGKPSSKDYDYAFEAIKTMGISELTNRSFSELSGGERQQVAIARILVQNPQLILLDEPTSALDFGNQIKVVKMAKSLSEKGYSVIMTTHNPDHAIMLNGVVGILDRSGSMEVGAVDEILTEEHLSFVYQTDVKISYVDKICRYACLATF